MTVYEYSGQVLPALAIKYYDGGSQTPLDLMLRWRLATEQAEVYTLILLENAGLGEIEG